MPGDNYSDRPDTMQRGPELVARGDGRAAYPQVNAGAENSIAVPNRIREISIRQLEFGYIVRVGCSEMAIGSAHQLLDALAKYLHDPAGTEKRFADKSLF